MSSTKRFWSITWHVNPTADGCVWTYQTITAAHRARAMLVNAGVFWVSKPW